MQGVRKHAHLVPRTSTQPIRLSEYVEANRKSRLVDDETLNPEWKAWYDRVEAKLLDGSLEP